MASAWRQDDVRFGQDRLQDAVRVIRIWASGWRKVASGCVKMVSIDINTGPTPTVVALASLWRDLPPLLCACPLTMVRSTKRAKNDLESLLNIENTLRRIFNRRFNTKMDKRSGLWQVDLTRAAKEALAFVTPKGAALRGREYRSCLSGADEEDAIYPVKQTPCTGTGFPRG